MIFTFQGAKVMVNEIHKVTIDATRRHLGPEKRLREGNGDTRETHDRAL